MSTYSQMKNSVIANPTMKSDQFKELLQSNGLYVYKHRNYDAYNDKRTVTSINPNTTIPQNLNNNSLSFRIDSGLIDVLQYPSLHFTLVNSTGANGSVGASWNFIDNIEILGQNGSTQIARIYGIDLFHSFLFMDRNQYEAQASSLGMHATTYANLGTIIADGGSITLSLPIYHFFKAIQIAPSLIQSEIVLRFNFSSTALSHISATAFTVSSINLMLRGKDLKENSTKRGLAEVYHHPSIPLSLGHLIIDRQTIPQALVASATYNVTLNSLRGVCSFLMFTVRLASDLTTTANKANYVRMLNYDILDSSNKSLIGSYRRDTTIQAIDYANTWANGAYAYKQFQMMSWADAPRDAFSLGKVSGFAILTSNERLSFTTPSTLASGDYVIECYAYIHANLMVENGLLRLDRD